MSPKKNIKEDASSMGKKIREISISEFFSKNRHLLGFDNPMKSLLTTVREGVDNALDACEEAQILPEINVVIREQSEGRYIVSIEDNGPGILKSHLPNIFGKLLYGSKFHRLKQSRGQQGIGISAAVMYGQMTTGKNATVFSKTLKTKRTHRLSLQIDTKKNAPKVLSDKIIKDTEWALKDSGTKVAIELTGAYKESKHGVLSYIQKTALSNPHAKIQFVDPKEKLHDFPRLINELPKDPKEIKPHPLGIELGTLIQFLHGAKGQTLLTFLKSEFCRVSSEIARSVCKKGGVRPSKPARSLDRDEAEAIYNAIQNTNFLSPPTNCLSPLGEQAIIKALYWFFVEARTEREIKKANLLEQSNSKKTSKKATLQNEFNFEKESEETSSPSALKKKIEELTNNKESAVLDEDKGFFVTAVSRPPAVYRGNPFQIEVGIFYGASLPSDELVQVYRYANRVPLQYQASACAMTKSVMSAPWKAYGLNQSRGALPAGPVVIMVSISSVWVPYTSESKEAVAHYPEIIKELRLALMEGGRRLKRFLGKRKRQADEAKKRAYIEKYLNPIEEALSDILGSKVARSKKILTDLEYILEKGREHKSVKMSKHVVS